MFWPQNTLAVIKGAKFAPTGNQEARCRFVKDSIKIFSSKSNEKKRNVIFYKVRTVFCFTCILSFDF